MRRRRREDERFPGPLREFIEDEWPPVPGECLGIFSCHGNGYRSECVPRPGEECGGAYRAGLARDYAHRPEVLAAALRADACIRWKAARLNWLGKDHPGWLEEFIEDSQAQIRYAPFRGEE